jgi:hypothetical protein
MIGSENIACFRISIEFGYKPLNPLNNIINYLYVVHIFLKYNYGTAHVGYKMDLLLNEVYIHVRLHLTPTSEEKTQLYFHATQRAELCQ